MKIMFLSLSTLWFTSSSYGQWDQKKYDQLLHKGDSLYQVKDYKASAVIYEAHLDMISNSIAVWNRWVTARSWAAADYPDSAFKHLVEIDVQNRPFHPFIANILTDTVFRNLHADRRWIEFKNKLEQGYKEVAKMFTNRIRSGYWSKPTNDGYDAARAWAAANERDSAFFFLNLIINSNDNTFINYPRMISDVYLLSLQGDQRWQPIVDAVKEKWAGIPTTHSLPPAHISITATVDPLSEFLKDDGKGGYVNGKDKVHSEIEHAFNLELSGHKAFYLSGDRRDLSHRYMKLDLNRPIKASGAIELGIIKDNDLELHVLYRIDTTLRPQVVYNFNEVPVGSTVESDRTEINFYVENELHTLTFGPWGLGRNNEAIAHGGRIHGNGTTPVKITRHNEKSYTITAPQGSMGRLWKTHNMTKPVDMGLYESGFAIRLVQQ